MSRIEHDIGSGREERRTILNELADARIDNGELRDIANRLKQQVVETGASQVKEAAAGAAEGAATVAAKTAVAAPGSKTWRYVITVLAGIAAVSGVAQGLPHIVKFLSTIWKALEGLAK